MQKWHDYRLIWNASKFGNVSQIYVPISRLWIPDITLWNKYVKRLKFKLTILISAVMYIHMLYMCTTVIRTINSFEC